MRRLKNISRNINKNQNVNRFLDMSRRRKTNDKANNSNFIGREALVLKPFEKDNGREVIIKDVKNGIAELVDKDNRNGKSFYLPLNKLLIYGKADEVKRHSDTSSLVQELDNIAECFGEFAKWCESNFGDKDNNEPIFEEPKDDQEDDSEKNYSNHILEGGDLIVKCSKFCRDYKVSPIYFISELSKHLYYMHERYAPKDKK